MIIRIHPKYSVRSYLLIETVISSAPPLLREKGFLRQLLLNENSYGVFGVRRYADNHIFNFQFSNV